MRRPAAILMPSDGAAGWKRFLAQPDLHWKAGRSASAMAHSWEQSRGWPPAIAALIEPQFAGSEPLLVIPEWKTPLPGGERSSQSDAFVLARHAGGLLAMTIEGKVHESFGSTVADRRRDASAGAAARLDWLCERLGLGDCPGDVHYQLLHRSASALIEAERFDAGAAAMIVHSFAADRRWHDAFARFVALLGGDPDAPGLMPVRVPGAVPLWLGWASDVPPPCLCQPACHEPKGITAA